MKGNYREHELRRILWQEWEAWVPKQDTLYWVRQVLQESVSLLIMRSRFLQGSMSATTVDRIVLYVLRDAWRVLLVTKP